MDFLDVMGMMCILICFVPIVGIAMIGSIVILIMDLAGHIRGVKMEDECRNCKYRMYYEGQICCMNEKSGAYKKPVKDTDYCGAYLWKNAKIKRP